MFQLEALTRQSRRPVAVISAFYDKCPIGQPILLNPQFLIKIVYLS